MRIARNGLYTTLTWLGGLVMFAPIAWMVLTSFKTEETAIATPPQLFFAPTLEHYSDIFNSDFLIFLGNSLAATLISTAFVIALAVPAAYALSIRPIGAWRDALFFFISTNMMPAAAGIVPIYVIAKNLGILNSVTLLIVLYIGMNLPLAIWMIRSFMIEVPIEIAEAARVDGAGQFREIVSIIGPLILPGVGATALLCGIFAWNEFFYAVNLTTTNSTLPIFLQKFLSFGKLYTAQVAAVATLINVPVVLAGWIAQKNLVRGLTFGAVK
jgi:sorbitol/mannitol transport system permease protein